MLNERLPDVFSVHDNTNLGEWLKAHQAQLDRLDADINQTKEALRIAEATNNDLDEIGEEYGVIGERRGRDDDEYRLFLMTLVQAYNGRGTKPGVERAIAAGLSISVEDNLIEFTEDFEQKAYWVHLSDWPAHRSSTIREMADLADPSGVEQKEPVYYELDSGEIGIGTEEVTIKGIETVVPNVMVGISTDSTITDTINNISIGVEFLIETSSTQSENVGVGLSGHQIGYGNQLGDGQ